MMLVSRAIRGAISAAARPSCHASRQASALPPSLSLESVSPADLSSFSRSLPLALRPAGCGFASSAGGYINDPRDRDHLRPLGGSFSEPSGLSARNKRPEPKLDLVEKYLSPESMCQEEEAGMALKRAQKAFQRHEHDTGSSEVQVAVLSERLAFLKYHCQVHRKDQPAKRRMELMYHHRQRILRYLRRTDGDRYYQLIRRLRIKDEDVFRLSFIRNYEEMIENIHRKNKIVPIIDRI